MQNSSSSPSNQLTAIKFLSENHAQNIMQDDMRHINVSNAIFAFNMLAVSGETKVSKYTILQDEVSNLIIISNL